MIREYGAVTQTLIGTLFTWGFTAAGSGLVFFFNSEQEKVLDGSLGFASGVMIAASFWSLLSPAIEIAKNDIQSYYSLAPVVIGFLLGALFVHSVDIFFPQSAAEQCIGSSQSNQEVSNHIVKAVNGSSVKLRKSKKSKVNNGTPVVVPDTSLTDSSRWRKILLLLIAITVHNIPEGLAVGVGFGAINKTESSTYENARNLAVGIGIQNFPEGLAVSLPLRGAGLPLWKCFWYGQLSGAVEPLAGLVGAAAVSVAEPILPYALAFAAGAMIFVVLDDIVSEAHSRGNGKLATWASILGFLLMMVLDVGLSS